MNPIFIANVENGKLKFYDLKNLNNYVFSLNSKDVEVIIRLPRKDRSNPQNRYMWGVVYELLSEVTGYTPSEIHDAMWMLFLQDNLRKIPTLRSTTELTTVEMENYLEQIRIWATQELNCSIPLPNEVEA